jgi:hypothetical protein
LPRFLGRFGGSGSQLSTFGRNRTDRTPKDANCGHFGVRFRREHRLTSGGRTRLRATVTTDIGVERRGFRSREAVRALRGDLRSRPMARSGDLATTGETLPQRGGRALGPKDLGEASARRRVTKPTHSRTRTEIRDFCVIWAVFGGSGLRLATFGRTGRTGHRNTANCVHFAVRCRSEHRLTSGWPMWVTLDRGNRCEGVYRKVPCTDSRRSRGSPSLARLRFGLV